MSTYEWVKLGIMATTLVVLVAASAVVVVRQHLQYERMQRNHETLLAEIQAQGIKAAAIAEEFGGDGPSAAPLPVQVERRHGMHVVRAERPMVRRVFALLAAATG